MIEESTSFDFDPVRLNRLVKTRRAQSVEFELQRYKHWGVIRSTGDDLAPMSLKLDESTCATNLTNSRDHEDLRAALGTLRRVNGRASRSSYQIKHSVDVESSTATSTSTRVLRPLSPSITQVVSLRKTSDKRTLEAVAQIAKRLPLDTRFSQHAPVYAYNHLQRSESTWDASCLLYYSSLIEGTLFEPNVDAVTAASSVSTVEHQCPKETPSKTRDGPFLLLFVLMLVSSWFVVSTNVFIEPMRQSLNHQPTVLSLYPTVREMQDQISTAWERQDSYSRAMNSWLGDTLRPLMLVMRTVLGRVDNFQPTALLDDVGAPDSGALLNMGSRCEGRVHEAGQGLIETDNNRHPEVGDRFSSLHWKPDDVPYAASEGVLQSSSACAVIEDPMLVTLLKLEVATRMAAKEEFSFMAIFLEKCYLFSFHEMCPFATRSTSRADETSRVIPLPVVESTMVQLARGPQRTKLKLFVGDVWMHLRQIIKVWTPLKIKDGPWKARASGLLRKWENLFRSILTLPERNRSAVFRLNHGSRNRMYGDIMGTLRKFILKLPAITENGYRSKK